MGIVMDMIGQGGDKLTGGKIGKSSPKSKEEKETADEKALGTEKDLDKESAFAQRKSRSEKFRSSMGRQPMRKGKGSFSSPRTRKAR